MSITTGFHLLFNVVSVYNCVVYVVYAYTLSIHFEVLAVDVYISRTYLTIMFDFNVKSVFL